MADSEFLNFEVLKEPRILIPSLLEVTSVALGNLLLNQVSFFNCH